MLKLIDAEIRYLNQYKKAYEKAMECINKGEIKKHDLMFLNPDEVDVVQAFMDNRDITKLKPERVPSYDYFLVDDDKFIGVIHIRIRLTDNLLRYGGHIGYGINPQYFKMGYGTKLLKLGLEKAKELGVDGDILITCDDDNIGSYKIIENNGGILENKIPNEDQGEKFLTRRYWIKARK